LPAIADKESIKYLELWQIRGLGDIGVVSSLSGLQFLFVQSYLEALALEMYLRQYSSSIILVVSRLCDGGQPSAYMSALVSVRIPPTGHYPIGNYRLYRIVYY